MSKGTPSFGKHNKVLHETCKRCGHHAYNMKQKVCVKCGYGKSKRILNLKWRWAKPTGKGNRKK